VRLSKSEATPEGGLTTVIVVTVAELVQYRGGKERGSFFASAPHDCLNCVPIGPRAPRDSLRVQRRFDLKGSCL